MLTCLSSGWAERGKGAKRVEKQEPRWHWLSSHGHKWSEQKTHQIKNASWKHVDLKFLIRCAARFHLCSSRQFLCKKKTAFKHIMNVHKKKTNTTPKSNKIKGEQHESWTSRERAENTTFVYNIGRSTATSSSTNIFWKVCRLCTRPNDSFWLNTWLRVLNRHDQMMLLLLHVNDGFGISDQP